MGTRAAGPVVLAVMLAACAAPRAPAPKPQAGRTPGHAATAPRHAQPPPAALERIDVCAGALIGLRGIAETLREEVASTRARGLVWRGERGSYLGRTTHQVDWNPALDHLSSVMGGVDGWISSGLARAASAYTRADTAGQRELEETVQRSGEAIRAVAVYLAGIRAAQYALHEAPPWVVGCLGFNDGLIDRLDALHGRLEKLRAAAEVATLKSELDVATEETTVYIDSYFKGLQDGGKLLEVAHVASIVTGAVGMTRALAATARLLAGAAVETGGLTLSLAGAGAAGSAAGAAATEASVQGILKGIAVATGAGALSSRMAGGMGPVNAGLDGELRAGITGPKERIPSLMGTAKYRIPDRVTELTLEEVKNVVKLSRTRQLVDYLEYCKQTRRTLVLWVRPTTKIAKPLMRFARGDS